MLFLKHSKCAKHPLENLIRSSEMQMSIYLFDNKISSPRSNNKTSSSSPWYHWNINDSIKEMVDSLLQFQIWDMFIFYSITLCHGVRNLFPCTFHCEGQIGWSQSISIGNTDSRKWSSKETCPLLTISIPYILKYPSIFYILSIYKKYIICIIYLLYK